MVRTNLRILFLGTQMAVGGAQRVLLNQAQWFYDEGYEVTTAFFYDKEDLEEEWKAEYPFPIENLGAHRQSASLWVNGFLLSRGIIRLWKLIRKHEFDLIETFTPDSNLLGLLVARLAGVPVRVGSHHGYIEGVPRWRGRLHGWMVNHGFAHCLVAVSKQVCQIAVEVEKIHPDKVEVILNGIEIVKCNQPRAEIKARLREELNLSSTDFVYLSIGRITVQKGHTYLLEAIPQVLAHYPKNTTFLIAGEGHLRSGLQEKATNLGIDHDVHFLGTRSDIPDLLNLADVFVLPSLWEGLPLALLEAMSAGLPVVATRVEGVTSLIEHGGNGYLLPPKDVHALAAALIKIREDDLARERFGRTNRELITREYTTEKMCTRYAHLFEQLFRQENPG